MTRLTPKAMITGHTVMMGAREPEGMISRRAFDALGEQVDERALITRVEGQRVRDAALILYTSGTTSAPRGAILSHEANVRIWMTTGRVWGTTREDRHWTALPLYHVNSGVLSLFGAILTGNCQVQPERFHPQRWWREIAETKATIVHYLGIIAAMLHSQPPETMTARPSSCR